MTYLDQTDFDLQVARGLVSGVSGVNKFGRNPDVDSGGDEDVWSGGGTRVPPTTARTHAIVSASANDASAGTGMRTVYIQGLDGSYATTSETVTLNGTTPVNTSNSYLIIHRMYGLTFGSGGTNAGLITATANTDSTVTAQITAGLGQTLMAIYQVPAGYTAYVHDMNYSMQNTVGGAIIDIALWTKDFGSDGWRTREYQHLNNSGNSSYTRVRHPYLAIPEKTIIKVRALNASSNNTDVVAGFNLYLVTN